MAEFITEELHSMRAFFERGVTHSYAFRKENLQKLVQAIRQYEKPLQEALYSDLGKSAEESWVTETGCVLAEARYILNHLKAWMQPEKVTSGLINFPSSSFVIREPLGVVLILSPWNYPMQLLINPLIGAIAAGNCAVVKASEFAPATTAVLRQLIAENFPPHYIRFVDGPGAEVVPAMISSFRFDHIFYTGGTAVGKKIYQQAAEQLIPVTLELGGKSPCVVEADANIRIAARRITVTKFSNTGQMCIAPDYILVHESRKEELVAALKKCIHDFYGDNPQQSYDFGKIIHEKHFDRLTGYLDQGRILYGGRHDREHLYLAPTLMDDVSLEDPVMQEEIFGPVLLILTFKEMQEAIKIIRRNPNPLAFYLFTNNSKLEKTWLEQVAFGGGCINNCSWHFTNVRLPFGGRGNSGIGSYHGKHSFETFSHAKGILKTPTWFDPAIKYPPLKGKLGLLKRLIR